MKSPADRIASAHATITDRLCAEIRSRAERGVQKYGVTLDEAKLTTRQVLQHAKEEALDLAAYLERLIAALVEIPAEKDVEP